ncbi:MAG: S8 family serine peptidase [Chloroflexota bacterium]
MKSIVFRWLIIALLLVCSSPHPGQNAAGALEEGFLPARRQGIGTAAAGDIEASQTGLYIVRFERPALAAIETRKNGRSKVNISTPASLAYTKYLQNQQQAFLDRAERLLNRPIDAAYRYLNVLNAIAVSASTEEAHRLAQIPGVAAVYADKIRQPDSDAGPAWIGADDLWDGSATGGLATQGEGVIVGIIDTGINHAHPSFSDPAPDGYQHINPWGGGSYRGICAANDPHYIPGFCNNKLIAAYSFYPGIPSPEDLSWHGSHTASTAAGNAHAGTVSVAGSVVTRTISGVAPRANLIVYKICHPHADCPESAALAAINQAVADGVDVLNYSISGDGDPWNDPVDLAFLDATNAGIFVSTSAGNGGPTAGSTHHNGPWEASMAMSTHPRVFAKTLDITHPGTPSLQGLAAVANRYNPNMSAALIGEIAYDAGNLSGCIAFPAGYFNDKFALLQRSTDCSYSQQAAQAIDAGAALVVLYDDRPGPPADIRVSGLGAPVVMLGLQDGLSVREHIAAQSPLTVTACLNAPTQAINNPGFADLIHLQSARGPSNWAVLKPDYAAPGVNILAAGAGSTAPYLRANGTSMASPHGAGAAALLLALHPDWSPTAVKSALGTTATPWWEMQADQPSAGLPATPYDAGAGRLDLSGAGRVGLIMDESYIDYLAANPALGGDPQALNQPALVAPDCVKACSWVRSFVSVANASLTYSVTFFTNVPTLTLSAEPAFFTIAPGATQAITIHAQVDALPFGQPVFGSVQIAAAPAANPTVAVQRLPVAVVPAYANIPASIVIKTADNPGTKTVRGVQFPVEITALVSRIDGLSRSSPITGTLTQDPSPSDPYNGDGGALVHVLGVPEETRRLVFEIVQSEAQNADLFVGTGTTPSLGSEQCRSTTTEAAESCELADPAAGFYWVLVQNRLSGAPGSSDLLTLVQGVVVSGTVGNLSANNSGNIPAYQPFDITLTWNEPALQPGDFWYGLLTLGTSPASPGDIGRITVDLIYESPVYGIEISPPHSFSAARPGETVFYTLQVLNTGNASETFTATVQAAWPASIPAVVGPLAPGEQAMLDVAITIPANTLAGSQDSACVRMVSSHEPAASAQVTLVTQALEPLLITATATNTPTPTPTHTTTPTHTPTSTPGLAYTRIYLPVLIK